jgi:hypothetical protein
VCYQINLEWTDNSDNENGFKIERSEDGVAFNQIDTVGQDVSIYSDTGLAENTLYWYRVRAYNTGGNSNYSNEANYTTPPCPPGPPAAPSGLAAKVRGKNKIALKWQDNSNNEDEFNIYRGPSPTSLSFLETVVANATSYLDTGLDSNTTYYYKVCASNTYGEKCSATVNAKTK